MRKCLVGCRCLLGRVRIHEKKSVFPLVGVECCRFNRRFALGLMNADQPSDQAQVLLQDTHSLRIEKDTREHLSSLTTMISESTPFTK